MCSGRIHVCVSMCGEGERVQGFVYEHVGHVCDCE